MCYFYNVKQQQLKQNKFTQLIVTLHIQTHYMAHNNQTTMLIKSKEHLDGALFGAYASICEIEQVYPIEAYKYVEWDIEEAGEVFHLYITWTLGESVVVQKRDYLNPEERELLYEEMVFHYHKSTNMYKVLKDFIAQLESIYIK